jgi:hypothetical protein
MKTSIKILLGIPFQTTYRTTFRTLLLKVPVVVPSQKSELSCIYVLGVSILLFDF